MDYKEPDLEELIQNDLRTEISKILGQSEVVDLEITANKSHDDTDSKHSPLDSSNNRNIYSQSTMVVKEEAYHSEDEQHLVQSGLNVNDSSSIPDGSHQHPFSLGHQEITGHFSVGSYADFGREMGHYPVTIGEHNDLQSLTWLTTVDVHALQKLTEQGTVITTAIGQSEQMNQQDTASSSEDNMPAQRSVIQRISPMQVAGTSNNNQHLEQLHNSHQPTTSTQFMPVQQPTVPDERCYSMNHQRYQIQPHHGCGAMSRNSYESSTHGSRRYMPLRHHHPYPPPPYSVNRAGYARGGPFMHPRYHHQGQQPKVYPKPVYSYSCLIAMALYNSKTGCLPVSEIYSFMMENYPYFKTAPDGWKNSVRHNLSLNKCFEKVEKPNGSQRKGCLWALNPAKIAKMKEEVQKWKRKDPESIRRSMSNPEELDRELEEMRRADEEAARRRMLSLSSHGLTAPSLHGHHQHPSHHHPPNLMKMSPHTSPSRIGSGSSMSLDPHQNGSHRRQDLHFSTELAQQNFALTLAKSALQASNAPAGHYDHQLPHRHSVSNSPSVNFGCVSSTDSGLNRHASSTDMIVLTPGGDKTPYFSTMSSASNSPNGAGMMGGFTECNPGYGGEEDLDASLADLAVLHESFWEPPSDSRLGRSSDAGDINDPEKSAIAGGSARDEMSGGQIRLPPVIRMLSSAQSGQPSPDAADYKSPAGQRVDNFGREIAHFSNNNIKPVAMMQ